jgi:hypothetical protein
MISGVQRTGCFLALMSISFIITFEALTVAADTVISQGSTAQELTKKYGTFP